MVVLRCECVAVLGWATLKRCQTSDMPSDLEGKKMWLG